MTSAIINTMKKLARTPDILGWNRARALRENGKCVCSYLDSEKQKKCDSLKS